VSTLRDSGCAGNTRTWPPTIMDRKNERGAEAFSAFGSVIQTAVKKRVSSTIDTLHNLFRSKPRDGPGASALGKNDPFVLT